MELNFLGTISLTKQVLPHMMERGTGSIVTVSSVAGLIGAPLRGGYSASKHALQVPLRTYHFGLYIHIYLDLSVVMNHNLNSSTMAAQWMAALVGTL